MRPGQKSGGEAKLVNSYRRESHRRSLQPRSYIATISRSDRIRRCHRGDESAGLIHHPVQMPSEAEEEVAQRGRSMPTQR